MRSRSLDVPRLLFHFTLLSILFTLFTLLLSGSMTQKNCYICFTVSLILISLLGCGDDKGTVPVSGTVTFDGGPMPGEGTVQFHAIEAAEGYSLRTGVGEFDTDGFFQVKSFKEGDGLTPGKYRVGVHCWKVPPSMEGPPPVSHLPTRYMNSTTSSFELTVEPGSSPITFDVPLESSSP